MPSVFPDFSALVQFGEIASFLGQLQVHPNYTKKPRKAKKWIAKGKKPQLDVNQLGAKMVQRTIKESGG
jgi:hypothetical protein